MADKEQDPFAFIVDDCRYSCSQEELLTEIPFAGEGKIIFDNNNSPEMKHPRAPRRKSEYTDVSTNNDGSKSTAVDGESARAKNLGFGGERVKEGELKKHKTNEEEEDEVVVISVKNKKKVRFEIDESEKKIAFQKRKLPRSMFETGWDDCGRIGPLRDDIKPTKYNNSNIKAPNQHIANVPTTTTTTTTTRVRKATVDDGKSKDEQPIANHNNNVSVKNAGVDAGKGDCGIVNKGSNVQSSTSVGKPSVADENAISNDGNVASSSSRVRNMCVDAKSKGGGDETNKCISDALTLLVPSKNANLYVRKVDIFETANVCGMEFPTSRFRSKVQADD